MPVKLFSELLDCVDVAETLLELETVDVCEILEVTLPCDVSV